MSKLKIKYVGKRDILNFHELSDTDQKSMLEMNERASDCSFFKNENGEVQFFDFLIIKNNEKLKSFHGYMTDSYFSGSLVILNKDCDSFKLFTFYS